MILVLPVVFETEKLQMEQQQQLQQRQVSPETSRGIPGGSVAGPQQVRCGGIFLEGDVLF